MWEVLYTTAQRRGATIDAARRLPQLIADAGLRLIEAHGKFRLLANAREPIEATLTALQSARSAVVEQGVATDVDVELLLQQLRAALNEEFSNVLGYLAVHAIAQVP